MVRVIGERLIWPAGRFLDVRVGQNHASGVVTADRSVACWGSSTSGEATPLAGHFSTVRAQSLGTCGLHLDGRVACWGCTGKPPAGTFSSLSAGTDDPCALAADGTASC